MMIWRRFWSKIFTKLKRETLKLSLLAKIMIKVTKWETRCLVRFMVFLPGLQS